MTPRSYITFQRLEQLVSTLSEVDLAVLGDLLRLRVMTGLQLQRIHDGDDDAAKQRRIRRLARLSRAQLVTRLQRRVGGPGGGSYSSIYALATAGRKLLALDGVVPRHPWTPSAHHLMHTLAITDVYTRLRVAERAGEFRLDQVDTEPTCWRRLSDRGGPLWLKPDARIVVSTEQEEFAWWLELDRGSESLPRITAKCRVYVDYWLSGGELDHGEIFPRVLWIAPDTTRVDQIAQAINRLDTADQVLFAVCTLDEATDVIGGASDGVQL